MTEAGKCCGINFKMRAGERSSRVGDWERCCTTVRQSGKFSPGKRTWHILCLGDFSLSWLPGIVGLREWLKLPQGVLRPLSQSSWGTSSQWDAHDPHISWPNAPGYLGWRDSQGMGKSELKPGEMGIKGISRPRQCFSRILLVIWPQWALNQSQSGLAVQGSSFVLVVVV